MLLSGCFGNCFGPSSLVPSEYNNLDRCELKRLYERCLHTNNGRLIVHGVFARANTKNNNKRIYPKHILKREVCKYEQDRIKNGTALGELDHPNYASRYFKCLNLPNISHQVLDIYWEGDLLWGTIEILKTPSGLLLWELYSQGIKLGVSSRGWASLKTDSRTKCVYVDEDFELITFDFVTEPSTKGAFLVPIRKSFKGHVPDQSKAVQIAHLGHGVVSMDKIPLLPSLADLVSHINYLQRKEQQQQQNGPNRAATTGSSMLQRAHPLDQLLLYSHYLVFPTLTYLDKEAHARLYQAHLATFATRAHLADQRQCMSRSDLNAIILKEVAKQVPATATAGTAGGADSHVVVTATGHHGGQSQVLIPAAAAVAAHRHSDQKQQYVMQARHLAQQDPTIQQPYNGAIMYNTAFQAKHQQQESGAVYVQQSALNNGRCHSDAAHTGSGQCSHHTSQQHDDFSILQERPSTAQPLADDDLHAWSLHPHAADHSPDCEPCRQGGQDDDSNDHFDGHMKRVRSDATRSMEACHVSTPSHSISPAKAKLPPLPCDTWSSARSESHGSKHTIPVTLNVNHDGDDDALHMQQGVSDDGTTHVGDVSYSRGDTDHVHTAAVAHSSNPTLQPRSPPGQDQQGYVSHVEASSPSSGIPHSPAHVPSSSSKTGGEARRSFGQRFGQNTRVHPEMCHSQQQHVYQDTPTCTIEPPCAAAAGHVQSHSSQHRSTPQHTCTSNQHDRHLTQVGHEQSLGSFNHVQQQQQALRQTPPGHVRTTPVPVHPRQGAVLAELQSVEATLHKFGQQWCAVHSSLAKTWGLVMRHTGDVAAIAIPGPALSLATALRAMT